ncbi:YitT family protein [Rossellomorea vietnamensis]|uniref:YitT family protein n=1 Tax=Rossellomorea TaxID=2837508 RepID=UPI001CCF4A89|nr:MULTISPECIES: YitT family protein [Rossellomorea]MCA0147936.1 YitT family protein [Rossellomorea vietnamensis]UTE76035.1 YitT family protein [Rossellomorea sp. KS-H15a]
MIRVFSIIIIGSIFVGIGINLFFVPHHFLDGGMIGIGLIAHYWLGVKPGLTIILLSIPLYLLAFFKDRILFYNSIHGLWLSSLMIDYFYQWHTLVHLPPLLSAFFGGAFVGIGVGLMLRGNSATGGSDLLAQLIGKSFGWNVGKLIFAFDSIVLMAGFPIIGMGPFLYSLLAVSTVGFFTTILTHHKGEDGFSFR